MREVTEVWIVCAVPIVLYLKCDGCARPSVSIKPKRHGSTDFTDVKLSPWTREIRGVFKSRISNSFYPSLPLDWR